MQKIIDYENFFTEDELSCVVTLRDICDCFNEIIPQVLDVQNKNMDFHIEQTLNLIKKFANELLEIQYKNKRDIRFVINAISEFNNIDKQVLDETYRIWCEEYDKLNKTES
jgi:hypothetical protein